MYARMLDEGRRLSSHALYQLVSFLFLGTCIKSSPSDSFSQPVLSLVLRTIKQPSPESSPILKDPLKSHNLNRSPEEMSSPHVCERLKNPAQRVGKRRSSCFVRSFCLNRIRLYAGTCPLRTVVHNVGALLVASSLAARGDRKIAPLLPRVSLLNIVPHLQPSSREGCSRIQSHE